MPRPTQSETSAAPPSRGEKGIESELGRQLRRISDKIIASGEKRLARRELEREVASRRGGIQSPE